jgi:protein SCO1/2
VTDGPVPFRAALGELARLKVFWAVLIVGTASVALMLSLGRSGAPVSSSTAPSSALVVNASELPSYGTVPAFSLIDQMGAAVTEANLRGKVWIASFIFTRCPTVCPVVTMKMKNLGERVAQEPAIRLLSFSVDPDHDTPSVLAGFAAKHGADAARWTFLTGDAAAVRSTVEGGLKIGMSREGTLAGGVPDIVHGTHLVLIDGSLRIRGYYDYSDPERLLALERDAIALAGVQP